MIFFGALLLAAWTASAAPEPRQRPVTQVTVREQILVRVPVRVRPATPAPTSLVEWEEKRGPKCVPAASIQGASLIGQRSVDLILRDRSRVRAKLEDRCPALDFYYGFYVSRNEDGQICADRDFIKSRVGGQCEIEKFRALKPVIRD